MAAKFTELAVGGFYVSPAAVVEFTKSSKRDYRANFSPKSFVTGFLLKDFLLHSHSLRYKPVSLGMFSFICSAISLEVTQAEQMVLMAFRRHVGQSALCGSRGGPVTSSRVHVAV